MCFTTADGARMRWGYVSTCRERSVYGGSSLSWDGWCRDRNSSLVRASFDWLECDGIVQVKIPRAAVTKIKQHPLDAKEKRKR